MARLAARRPPIAIRLLSAPVVGATLAAGVWVAGGVLTNDFRASVALTAAWFAVCGAACLAVALRARAFRLPVVGGYAVAAAAIGGYLAFATFHDRVVDEPIAPGVELLRAGFRSAEHATTGTAAVVRAADGRRFLALTSFSTSPGPDLRVRLVPGDSVNGGAAGAVDLGALKGNRGDQQYRLPPDVRVEGHTVVIWCRAFTAPFGFARL